MQAVARPGDAESRRSRAMHHRERYLARNARLASAKEIKVQKEKLHRVTTDAVSASSSTRARAVAQALARARERLAKIN